MRKMDLKIFIYRNKKAMILTKEIEIKIVKNNRKYYKSLGYDIKLEKILVKIEDLPKFSHTKIKVKCDYCGKEKEIQYNYYNTSISILGKYACYKCGPIKLKENTLKKYGVDSTNKLESTQKNKIKTLKEKYGIENISQISQDKVRKTKLKKYGSESYNNRKKAIETTLERYGVENFRTTEQYKEKSKKTNLIKYGYEHYSQHPEIHRKQQISGYRLKKYKNLYYRGSYELDFIKYCEKNNIDIVNGPIIEYYSGETKKYYYSDFKLVNYNLICEIKSIYYYNLDLDMNLLKKDASLKEGYDFLFIIEKDYTEFIKKLKS